MGLKNVSCEKNVNLIKSEGYIQGFQNTSILQCKFEVPKYDMIFEPQIYTRVSTKFKNPVYSPLIWEGDKIAKTGKKCMAIHVNDIFK